MLEKLGGLMAERVTDLRDLGQRVLATLLGQPEPGIPEPEVPSILLAGDLAPADTAGLDPSKILALVTSMGGPTSHTAIIARQLGIPCVVAAPVDDIPVGTTVLVDGTRGEVIVDPDPGAAAALMEEDQAVRAAAAAYGGPGVTADGHAVQVLANVQDGPSAEKAAAGPSEGVGLFRSELAFLGRDAEPTVAEQADIYGQVFRAFEGRKVVIRTLDAGSDKPMKFATLPDEPNPALGVRGLRLSWANPGLMSRQLDAIRQAADATGTEPWVMAPMVATAAEARDFAAQVRDRGLTVGVMIEVPAAALLAAQILDHVDFLSIGTNDLAQYTMAADRLAGDLASLTDYWQPAVVYLMSITAQAGEAVGKPVGVCGEAAADPLMACVLVGLGMSSLSMAASAVGAVGAKLASVTHDGCQAAAAAALAAPDPAAARAAAAAAL
jgi:phosphotransferase system enzyme I (PtsI)